MRLLVVSIVTFAALLSAVVCDEVTHSYEVGERIPLWVNKVGPYRNPQETYEFYSLPYCQPTELIDKGYFSGIKSLGEALTSYELHDSKIQIQFAKSVANKDECGKSVKLNDDEVQAFKHAVENHYWFEMFLDDLPVWGLVGESDPPRIYTHKKFSIKYNDDHIIEVSLQSDNLVAIQANVPIKFTYTVHWDKTNDEFESRFDRYLDNKFFEHQIHWFSIFNSFMMVIFLVGLVAMILMRTLRKDFARFSQELDEEEEYNVADESGWKQVHGDVFRAPPRLTLFASVVGAGTHLLVLSFLVAVLSVAFYYNHPLYRRGTVLSAFTFLYAFTSFIGGYVSGSYYAQHGGQNWIRTMFMTALIFPTAAFLVSAAMDFVALFYGSMASISIGTLLILILLFGFVSLPLTFAGTVLGRNRNGTGKFPCRIHPVPKPIPPKKPYQELWVHAVLGGILPFGSIFIEMYFVFTAIWQYKYYYVFGFLLLVFSILIVVTVCSTIVSTYFLLNAEDYRWQWTSFFSGSSTAVYVYLYAIYYFFKRTHMTGFLQVMFYFSYMGLLCFGIALITGAAGFLGARLFVHRIFRAIHVD